jgi:pimeloyl-ACP methyl ester carboxylesterase
LTRSISALAIILLIIVISGCDIPGDTPAAPSQTPYTGVPPSQTISPIMPTAFNPESGNVDAQGFTPRAPDVSDSTLSLTVTPTPAPTEANIPVQFPMGDGLIITGRYYGAPSKPAPTVLLLHGFNSGKEAWRLFAAQLQLAGNNVLSIDLRGYGETGGSVDWVKAAQDIPAVLDRLNAFPGVAANRISVIGADIGASAALSGCAGSLVCRSLVLISPALENQGLSISDTMSKYGSRPVLIVASRGDKPSGADSSALDKLAQGSHSLQLFDGTAHSMALLTAQPDLPGQIIEWLKTNNR